MAVRVLRAAERAASPWKNGGGVTREVAAWPEGSDLGGFHWRVSLADVAQGGPFSCFPGVDRVITVVRGAGMLLAVDGTEHRIFSGDAATDCRLLQGPLLDFNVMTRRKKTSARVDVVDGPVGPVGGDDRSTVLLLVLEGSAAVPGGGPRLGPLDALLLNGVEPVTVDLDGRAAVVTLRQLD